MTVTSPGPEEVKGKQTRRPGKRLLPIFSSLSLPIRPETPRKPRPRKLASSAFLSFLPRGSARAAARNSSAACSLGEKKTSRTAAVGSSPILLQGSRASRVLPLQGYTIFRLFYLQISSYRKNYIWIFGLLLSDGE